MPASSVRGGLLTEVVVSLGLVMLAATVVLASLLLQHNEARLRDLLGRALLAEARALPEQDRSLIPGTAWWRVGAKGAAESIGTSRERIDATTEKLADDARASGTSLVRPGAPWEAIRFATPAPGGEVVVARLPADASLRLRAAPLALVAALLALDVVVFTAFGASLLRRRVVAPLERLAAAARSLGEGGFETRLPVEGPREAAEVAAAFNAMSEALERRTLALEKAVADLRDVNAELRVARSGLDRAQRLAAVGRLAAGVAHEVGNPLAALLAFLGVAQRDTGMGDDTRTHLARAAQQGERVRRILRQLLEFSRPPRMESVPVDVAALAEEAIALVRAQRRYASVEFAVLREGEPPVGRGDPGAVAQILLNLLLNAADAVTSCEPGAGVVQLRVRGAPFAVRSGESREEAAARGEADAVECVVADQGSGIAPEDAERLFDPFFTTKPAGEGTGLGLANSLRLAEELSGALELVEPPEGFRTAFCLRLQAAVRTASGFAVRKELRGEAASGEPATQGKTNV
ncbi:MAG: sensor histidine kinase [Deltaproteobacteria bacterium]|nr:sensor histidine kinase [Deltaproteobacteria bacterium]